MYEAINLKYSYKDLEPYIDSETVRIHYSKHYMNYLNNLNKWLKKNNWDFNKDKMEVLKNINSFPLPDRLEILYNLGGVLNHELYFDSMNHYGETEPLGSIKEGIDDTFSNYENLKKEFINNGANIKGSGYVFLVLDEDGNLKVVTTSNQDTPYLYNLTPILAMDVWEHAYYLKHKNEKKDYFNDFFKVIDFVSVNDLYEDNKLN